MTSHSELPSDAYLQRRSKKYLISLLRESEAGWNQWKRVERKASQRLNAYRTNAIHMKGVLDGRCLSDDPLRQMLEVKRLLWWHTDKDLP